MSLPSDLELTKLRLWFHRAESRQHELEEDAYQARRDFEELWLRYVDRCKKLGFCAACEKPLPECRCVLVGAYLNEKPQEPPFVHSEFCVPKDSCNNDAGGGAASGSPQGLNDSQRDRAVLLDDRKSGPASPPHAAAEPDKPVAWYMPLSGRHAMIEWGEKRPDAGNINEWRPLYAAVQQPIARDALIAWIEENIYGWMDMQPESHGHDHDAIACDVAEFLKSAEGEK